MTVASGGVLEVFSGGLASGTFVGSGGKQIVFSGGSGSVTAVASDGAMAVSSAGFGATVSGASIGGTVTVSKGGVFELIGVDGHNFDLNVMSGGTGEIGAGATGNLKIGKGVPGSSCPAAPRAAAQSRPAPSASWRRGGAVTSDGNSKNLFVSSGGTFEFLGASTSAGQFVNPLPDATLELGSGAFFSGSKVDPGITVVLLSASTAILSGGTLGAGSLIEAASGGTAIVSGSLVNSGTLFASASGGLVEIAGGAVVSGGVVEVGNGIVDVLSGGSANVKFPSNGSGGLVIEDSPNDVSAFTGAVSGFGGANHANHTQFIDLTSVSFTSGQIHLSYTSAAGSGTLSVVSGATVVARIKMSGSYTSANFSAKADSDGNVEIVDPTVPNGGSVELGPARTFPRAGIDLPDIAFGAQTTLAYAANAAGAGGTLTIGDGRQAAAIALLGNYMAGSFVTTADGQGGTLLTQAAQTGQQLLLTHPKA
jgi:fibronectin-binding autotransporter adhesin